MPRSEWDGEPFVPLGQFSEPSLPAEEWFHKALGRVQALIARGTPKPFIADDRLQQATMQTLERVVAPPACGPLLAELERTVAGWLAEPQPASRIKVIALPPCDENRTVQAWAERHGHQVLPPPSREALIDGQPALPELSGDGLLVIPQLEAWFLRHRNGLRPVRALLAAADASDRPILIGCNSWAWAFLSKAVAADQILHEPVTFVAFDAVRLRRWFSHLATAAATAPMMFRRANTGTDVLDADADGSPKDDFLRTLAGRSLGIPWVAWHMWRRSLRSDGPSSGRASAIDDAQAMLSADPAEAPGEQTLWVAALDELVLPGKHEQSALLVLHALLIHGRLDAPSLRLVLPIVGESNIVSVLVKSGFVERQQDQFAIRPAAYPVIRSGLELAGLPLDRP